MSSVARIRIHPTQFPENVQRDLFDSLHRRQVNHKFHYDSVRQTQKWLALHQAWSPSRRDADCTTIYNRSFRAAVQLIKSGSIHVLGLGCGGGQKDMRLLKLLHAGGRKAFYTPCDVSTAMVLVARQTALAVVPEANCFPFVCDLATAGNLRGTFDRLPQFNRPRLLTFFGMIPNFEPEAILPKLAALVRRQDFLLFSANLAPGNNYAVGLKKILPQYDNPLTRDWLLTFLLDLGVERSDGGLVFEVEDVRQNRLKRVVANFRFQRRRKIRIADRAFEFKAGELIRLLFSYRYTPEKARETLRRYGLKVCDQWITKSEEEGVFLCRRG
jgi:uncharacterized SAM-dependent methyltransferase